MKVIFLDIDGVLNRAYTPDRAPCGVIGVEDYLISHLYDIVKYTGAEIVLTSTWKKEWSKSINYKSEDFKYLERKLKNFNLSIKDKTIDTFDNRGEGIKKYLIDHPEITNWVVLDDDIFDDYDDEIKSHLVQTSFCEGALSNSKAAKAIAILKE